MQRRLATKKKNLLGLPAPTRELSNVFAQFHQAKVAEFKEAFNMIDQSRDGFIDKEDLRQILNSLGESLWDFLERKTYKKDRSHSRKFKGLPRSFELIQNLISIQISY